MTRKPLAAALTAIILATSALAAPAQAGGSLSINLQPTNADQERAMRAGLAIYSIVNSVKSGAAVRQNGHGNSAGVAQDGRGNFGVVHQDGNGHQGTVSQRGNGNAYGLFQFGRNTSGHVAQNGNGRTGATFQFGW
ncbi:curlin [Mesorhizobium sp. CAU 1741]|uniref:curlin n=1 Tax=Mesorhizobium sp. CAU 1741 TaxID=3140366 RepID=UPI00325BB71C